MAKDPTIFTDVVELLADFEEELADRRWSVVGGDDEDLELRLDRVRDVRARLEGEFS